MPRINLFLDSRALFAGIASPGGAERALLLLGEVEQITLTISEQVVTECERSLARKHPQALPELRQAIWASQAQIVHNPSPEEVQAHADLISHSADVPILLAAIQARVDYLVTLNRRHFIDDPEVARRSGLRIGTPGDALLWVRQQLNEQ